MTRDAVVSRRPPRARVPASFSGLLRLPAMTRAYPSASAAFTVKGGHGGFLLQAARSARYPSRYAPRARSETGRDTRAVKKAPRVAPRRQRCVLDAALGCDDHPIRPERQ